MIHEEIDMKNRIQKIHCETCDELLEYMRPSHDRWLDDHRQCSWLFRGHQREEWKLEPFALRQNVDYFEPIKSDHHHRIDIPVVIDEFVRPPDPVKSKRLDDLLTQTICEKTAIEHFIEASDEIGLSIPDDHISRDFQLWDRDFMRMLFSEERTPAFIANPIDPANFHDRYTFIPWYVRSDVVALAQHHGIPTRLLDWTENPLKAAYFAANGGNKSENIAIWGINLLAVTLTELQLLKPRRNRIGFLHAQDGVFTYDIGANKHYFDEGNWRTVEDIVADLKFPSLGFPETEYWLRKVTFPSSKAEELLVLLKSHKVEKRFLMPTYDNVATELYRQQEIQATKYRKLLRSISNDSEA